MFGVGRSGFVGTGVVVAVTLMMVFVPGLGAAVPSTPGTSVVPGFSSWAYGAVKTGTLDGVAGMFVYHARATAGFAVILNETNPSPGVYVVTVNRTMGVLVSVQYCRPNCAHPYAIGTVTHHGWESIGAILTFTTHGNVTVNGTATGALALVSSDISLSAGLRDASSYTVNGILLKSKNLSADLSANASTTFTPALGLVPLELSPGETWNSTSQFNLVGAYHYKFNLTTGGSLLPTTTISHVGGGSLDANGSVALSGTYGGSEVNLGGTSYAALNLSVAGPFVLREGFLLVPKVSDLFGGASQPWSSDQSGFSNASQGNVDVSSQLVGDAHLGFYASGMWWRSHTVNPGPLATTGGMTPASTSVAPAVTPNGNSTYVQGQPESVAQATTDQNCLQTGVGCPLAALGTRGILGAWLVAAGVAIAAVVVIALVAERRRLPPPPYPNAGLYPPGVAARPSTEPRRPEPPSPTGEDDPLGHLW